MKPVGGSSTGILSHAWLATAISEPMLLQKWSRLRYYSPSGKCHCPIVVRLSSIMLSARARRRFSNAFSTREMPSTIFARSRHSARLAPSSTQTVAPYIHKLTQINPITRTSPMIGKVACIASPMNTVLPFDQVGNDGKSVIFQT